MHVQNVNLSHGLIINPYAMFNHEFKLHCCYLIITLHSHYLLLVKSHVLHDQIVKTH